MCRLSKFCSVLAFSLSLVFLFQSAALWGQRGASSLNIGNHGIEVHLTDQKGSPLNLIARVEILSRSGMRMAEAYSNREQGVADFEGFSDGTFQLQVSGPNLDTVLQSFQINATEGTHREYVRVELRKVETS